jgi:hypothetical protein
VLPLAVLALLSVIGGAFNLPHWLPGANGLHHFMEPVFEYGKVEFPDWMRKLKIKLGGGVYQMGIGGLHSTERTVAHRADAETLLIDRAALDTHLKPVLEKLHELGCEVRGDAEVQKRDPKALAATEKDWRTEYLEPIISVDVPPLLASIWFARCAMTPRIGITATPDRVEALCTVVPAPPTRASMSSALSRSPRTCRSSTGISSAHLSSVIAQMDAPTYRRMFRSLTLLPLPSNRPKTPRTAPL